MSAHTNVVGDPLNALREFVEQIAGYTIIPEDMEIRPAAYSYVKPSEFAQIVQSQAWVILSQLGYRHE